MGNWGLSLHIRPCWGSGSLIQDVPRSGRRTGSSRASTCQRWKNMGRCTRMVRQLAGEQAGWIGGAAVAQGSPDWPSLTQTALAACPGRTRKHTCCMWQRRSAPRLSPSFTPKPWTSVAMMTRWPGRRSQTRPSRCSGPWPVHDGPAGQPWSSVCSLPTLSVQLGGHWLLGGQGRLAKTG